MVENDNKKPKNGQLKDRLISQIKKYAKIRGLLYSDEAGEGNGGVQQGGFQGGPCVHHGNVVKVVGLAVYSQKGLN